MSKKFSSTIAGATILITVVSILSKGIGFLREIIYANNFGASAQFDIYLVSSVVPFTLLTVIFYITQNYYIPLFIEAKKEQSLDVFFNRNFLISLLASIALSMLLYVLAKPIISFYIKDNAQNLNLALTLFKYFLICIPISSINSYLISFLYAELEYAKASYSQIVQTIVIVIIIALSSGVGIVIIPLAFIVGNIAQAIFLMSFTHRNFKFNLFSKDFILKEKVIKKSILYIVLIEFIGQFYMLVDRYFYNRVDSGGIALLNYAYNVYLIPIGIITQAIATALFPRFSESVTNNNKTELRKNIGDIIKINSLIFIPLTFLLFFYGDILLKILYQRGKFSAENTAFAFEILKIFSLSLLFYSVYGILNKLFYSFNKEKQLFIITCSGILLKILLNFIFVKTYKQNGLAISTVITYLYFFVVTLIYFRKEENLRVDLIAFKTALFYLINAFVCYVIASNITFKPILNSVIFIILFYLNLWLTKEDSLINIIKRKIN